MVMVPWSSLSRKRGSVAVSTTGSRIVTSIVALPILVALHATAMTRGPAGGPHLPGGWGSGGGRRAGGGLGGGRGQGAGWGGGVGGGNSHRARAVCIGSV